MYVTVSLKVPNEGEWIALTNVDTDGETRSRGYVREHELRALEPLLRTGIADAEENGHPSMDTVLAWKDMLHHIEYVL